MGRALQVQAAQWPRVAHAAQSSSDSLAHLAMRAVRAYRSAPLDADTVELMADLEHVAKSSR
jgi:hypothetical protein